MREKREREKGDGEKSKNRGPAREGREKMKEGGRGGRGTGGEGRGGRGTGGERARESPRMRQWGKGWTGEKTGTAATVEVEGSSGSLASASSEHSLQLSQRWTE